MAKSSDDLYAELDALLTSVGQPVLSTKERQLVQVTGKDPLVSSSRIRFGAISSLPPLAVAVCATRLHSGGEVNQRIAVDMRKTIYGLAIGWGWNGPTIAGHSLDASLAIGNPFMNDIYETKDGRKILVSATHPELRLKAYSFLKVPPHPRSGVASAIAQYDALELEDLAEKAGIPCTMIRTPEEWLATEQGKAISAKGPVGLEKLRDGPIKKIPKGARPLEGVKVLMATHVIAGPVTGRSLAEHGADVLQVFHGFEYEMVYNEANVGCRSTSMNFKNKQDLERFWTLLRQCDVFIESFRPSSLAKFGITTETLIAANPSLIICSTKCFGNTGPWAHRAGFDMNAGAVTGAFVIGGSEAEPAFLELALCNDFPTGNFGALGIVAALERRGREGGSWVVSPALAQTAHWYVHVLGLVPEEEMRKVKSEEAHVVQPPDVLEGETPKGTLRRLGHAVRMEGTPCKWWDPMLVVQGSSRPEFL